MAFEPKPHAGSLHHYAKKLVAFERRTESTVSQPNVLVWIGGLGDGLLSVKYANTLADSLTPSWSLTQILLSSSYGGWGTSSLRKDVEEIAEFVAYIQKLRPGIKVVLMGHSTGSQDTLEYLTGASNEKRPKVHGAILQGGISDREGLVAFLPDGIYENSVKLSKEWMAQGRGEEILPTDATADFFGSPVSARRWLSLLSPDKDSEEDLFSSDLPISKFQSTFGKLKKETPLLILFGEEDEYVPFDVDKQKLVSTWTNIVKESGGIVDEEFGGIIPGATHNLGGSDDGVVKDLIRRVNGFLGKVESGQF